VLEGSPAAAVGLSPGDIVVRAGGSLVTGRADLVAAVRGLRPQDPLELVYLHDDKPRTVTATLKAGDPAMFAYAPAMG
jgi:S1-C subfamily serine protease